MANGGTRIISWLLVGALLTAGCASSGRRESPAMPRDSAAPIGSLESAIGQIRELSVRARPAPKHVSGPTIEALDVGLAAALLLLNVLPGPEAHRRVANEYARLGIFDAAHKHYRAALARDRRDAASYDGLARLWRDAGLPQLALGDARRAVYYAPHSPEARNTLGTVFQALGQRAYAKQAYEAALALDPAAAYALNNLGYLALLDGDASRAVHYFLAAQNADRTLASATHNLALAYGASDRMDLAREALMAADAGGRMEYNLGIINLGLGDKAEALRAFTAACRLDPAERLACLRAGALRSREFAAYGRTQ